MFCVIFLLFPAFLFSLPEGGVIIHGSAAFSKPSQAELEIAASDQAVLDWDSFSIGAGEKARFILPHDRASVINRVVGSEVSLIQGVLESDGRVFLLNPNGLLIGKKGVVDTASFVASTLPLAPWGEGRGGSAIGNEGRVSARKGDLCLIAPEIRNAGQLRAPEGRVALLAGTEASWSADAQSVFGNGILIQTGHVEGGSAIWLSSPGGSLQLEGAIAAKGEMAVEGMRIEITGPLVLNSPSSLSFNAAADFSIGSVLGNYDAGDITIESGGDVLIRSSPISSAQIFAQGGNVSLSARNLTVESCGTPAEILSLNGAIALLLDGNLSLAGGRECFADASARLVGENIQIAAKGNLSLAGGAGPQCLAEICAAGIVEAAIGGNLELEGGECVDRSYACISAGESIRFDVKGCAKLISGLGSSVQMSARCGPLFLSAGAIELRGNETAGSARIKGKESVCLASLESIAIERGEVYSKEGVLRLIAGQAIEAQMSLFASPKTAEWEAPRVDLREGISTIHP